VCTGDVTQETCAVTEEYGVFVRPDGSDVDGKGTRERPYATLWRAIPVALNAMRKVYACADAGPYAEPMLEIDDSLQGLSVIGAFLCAGSTWRYDAQAKAELIVPTPTAVRVSNTNNITLEHMRLVSSAGVTPGASSIAMMVVDSQNITLNSVEIEAGQGMDGSAGYAYPELERAAPGITGNAGAEACTTGLGGATVTSTACDSTGGKGGDGGRGASSAGAGDAGTPEPVPNDAGYGDPGVGQFGAGWSCETMGNGKAGADGAAAPLVSGGAGLGFFTTSGYTPIDGQDGLVGSPGQGGGGGGGAKAPAACAGGTLVGASGSSGGSGGCPGLGGGKGTGGGASIALLALDSTIAMSDVALIVGAAGNGGTGGEGQQGGSGGEPGAAGVGACPGGFGGKGGNGSAGGGGAGGPAIGVAYSGTAPGMTGVDVTLPTTAAAGGLSVSTQGDGADGVLAESLQVERGS
jgi:hypothetical protein